jgi:small-conductance mechanosensitive channel/predicted small secreted protein
MKRRSILAIMLILLSATLFLLSACSNPLEGVMPLPGGSGSSASEAEATIVTGESTLEAVASRTPVPTPTPGIIEIAVENFTENVGIEDFTFLGLTAADWINLAISVGLAILLYNVGIWLVRSFLRRLVARTPTDLDDQFLKETDQQIRWLIIVFALEISILRLQFISGEIKFRIQDITFIIYLLLFGAITWKLIDFGLDFLEDTLSQRMEESQVKTLMQIIRSVVRIFVVFTYLSILLDHFGINITAIAAIVGLGGLSLSLAAQDTIADFIGGIIIMLDQPFRVGDRIEVDVIKTWGDVTEIGMRTTKIRTRDNRLVMIPNSTIGNNPVVNYTYPDPTYRIQIEVGIGYGQNIDEIRRVIIETVENIDGVLKEKPVDALFLEFGDTNMVFRIRWWIDSYIDTRRMFDRVNQALITALQGAGIDMPFTTYDVNIKFNGERGENIVKAVDGQ